MPVVDRRTNSVVLRIVYDGPPEAGKTTNLRHLCERLSLSRRGALESPGGGDRTQFFDWLDVTGGWVGGHRVRCQLVTVPGQIQLARRRRHILDSADVIVLVADSRPRSAPETSAALRSLARGLGNRADVPLVLQANKQDLAGAQLPGQLHAALGLAARVPVIGAEATGGAGVLETFMLAVRLAVDHVRALLVAGELGEGDPSGAAELLRALEADAPEAFDALDAIARAADPPAGGPEEVGEVEPAGRNTTTRPLRSTRRSRIDVTAEARAAVALAASEAAVAATELPPPDADRPVRVIRGAQVRTTTAALFTTRAASAAHPGPPRTSDEATRPIRVIRCAPVRLAHATPPPETRPAAHAAATGPRPRTSRRATIIPIGAALRAVDPGASDAEPVDAGAAARPTPTPSSPATASDSGPSSLIALDPALVTDLTTALRSPSHPARSTASTASTAASIAPTPIASLAAATDVAPTHAVATEAAPTDAAPANAAPTDAAATDAAATDATPIEVASSAAVIEPKSYLALEARPFTMAALAAAPPPAAFLAMGTAPYAVRDVLRRDEVAPAGPPPISVAELIAADLATTVIVPAAPTATDAARAEAAKLRSTGPAGPSSKRRETDVALASSDDPRDAHPLGATADAPGAKPGGAFSIVTRTRSEPVVQIEAEVIDREPAASLPAAAGAVRTVAAAARREVTTVTAEVTVPDRNAADAVTVELVAVEAITLEYPAVPPSAAERSDPTLSDPTPSDPTPPRPLAGQRTPLLLTTDEDTTWDLPPVEPGPQVVHSEPQADDAPAAAVVRDVPPIADLDAAIERDVLPIAELDAAIERDVPPIPDLDATVERDVPPIPDLDATVERDVPPIPEPDAPATADAADTAAPTPPPQAPPPATRASSRELLRVELLRVELLHDLPTPTAMPRSSSTTPPPPLREVRPFQLPPVDVPAGMVWPGVSGRAALASIAAPVRVVAHRASWAPDAGIEVECGDGWVAHTSAALAFRDLDLARQALFEAARWQAKLAHLTPPGRTYALSPEHDGVRLWVLTPHYRCAWAAIEDAFARGDRGAASRLARLGLEAVDEIRARGVAIADLDHIAVDDPSRLLATPWSPQRDRLTEQLQRLFAAAVL
jgi:signal recognition particle receptor subunit beta